MDFGYRVKSPVGIPLGLTLVLSRTYPVAPAVTPIPGWIMASTGEGPLKERSLGTVATMPNPPLVGPLVAEERIPSVALAVMCLSRLTFLGPLKGGSWGERRLVLLLAASLRGDFAEGRPASRWGPLLPTPCSTATPSAPKETCVPSPPLAAATNGVLASPRCRRRSAGRAASGTERREAPRAGRTGAQCRSTRPARPPRGPRPDAYFFSPWPFGAPSRRVDNTVYLVTTAAGQPTSTVMRSWTTAATWATSVSARTSGVCTARRLRARLLPPPAGAGMMPYLPMIAISVVGRHATAPNAVGSGANSRRSSLRCLGRNLARATMPSPRSSAPPAPRCTPSMRPAADHLTLLAPLSGDC